MPPRKYLVQRKEKPVIRTFSSMPTKNLFSTSHFLKELKIDKIIQILPSQQSILTDLHQNERPQTYDSPFRCSAILLPIPCQGNHGSQNTRSGTSVENHDGIHALKVDMIWIKLKNTVVTIIYLPFSGSISIQFQQTVAF